MWRKVRTPLFLLSLGLNAAFIAIWLMHVVPGFIADRQDIGARGENGPDVLHRKIGVTPAQWQQIEPRIQEFREKAQARRRAIGKRREELMSLLALPSADEKTIRAKQDEILAEKRQMQKLVLDLLLLEKKVLEPAQQRALIAEIHRICCRTEKGTGRARGLAPVISGEQPAFSGEADRK